MKLSLSPPSLRRSVVDLGMSFGHCQSLLSHLRLCRWDLSCAVPIPRLIISIYDVYDENKSGDEHERADAGEHDEEIFLFVHTRTLTVTSPYMLRRSVPQLAGE
jgi:hypothetical protein